MIQCKDCEYFGQDDAGRMLFRCDPFNNIKEPECLNKWQLVKLNQMIAGYQSMLNYYHKLGPMQEKMFKVIEREMEDIDEADKWRVDDDDDDDTDDGTDDDGWRDPPLDPPPVV